MTDKRFVKTIYYTITLLLSGINKYGIDKALQDIKRLGIENYDDMTDEDWYDFLEMIKLYHEIKENDNGK